GDSLCGQSPPPAGAGLAAAASRAWRHRRGCVALAPVPSSRVPYAAIDLMAPLLRLLRYAAPHRMLIAGATLAMLVYGAGSAAQAWLIKPIIDDVLVLTQASSLRFVIVAIVVIYFFKGLGAYFSSYLMDDLGHRVVMRIRNDLFRHLLDQSAAFFARRTTG